MAIFSNIKGLSFLLGLAILLVSGCERIEREPIRNPLEAYKKYTGMDLPSYVSGFGGEHSDTHNLNIAKAYFQYKAPVKKYMAYMEKDWLEKSESEANDGFYKYDCGEASFPQGYIFWTDENLSFDGYTCYVATYYPIVHYLHVNEVTQDIRHFVSGLDNSYKKPPK